MSPKHPRRGRKRIDPEPAGEALRSTQERLHGLLIESARQRAMVDGINRVLREALICQTDEAVAQVCLAVAVELTGSQFGFIGEVNAAGRFDTIAQSDMGWKQCRVPGSDAQAAIRDSEIRGLWGLALKRGESALVNQPAVHPARVGVPEGHPPLTCFLGVPLKEAGQTVGMIGLANKAGGYTPEDQQAVEALSVAFWEALRRQRADEALRRERDLIRRMMETSPAGITLVDRSGQITFANARAEQVLGLTRDEITNRAYNAPGWQITDYEGCPFPDDELPFRRVLATGRPVQNARHAIQRPEGERVLLSINAAPLFDAAGQLAGVVATVEDETRRTRIEQALRESEEQFRNLAEESPNMIFINQKGKVVYANRKCSETMGYTREELLAPSFDFRALVAPESHPLIQSSFRRHLEGKEVPSYECALLTKEGKRLASIITTKLIRHRGELSILGIVTDISARKQVEETVRKSQRLLERTFASLRSALFIIDAATLQIIDCNPAASQVFGYRREELLGRTTASLHVDEAALEVFRSHLRSAMEKQGFLHLAEFRMRRKDGTIFPSEHNVMPLEDERGQRVAWVSVVSDITSLKQAESQLIEHQQRLRSLAAELSAAEQRERRRLANLLHDEVIQSLALAKIKLGAIGETARTTSLAGPLTELRRLIETAILQTRSLTFQLSPPILHELGLEPALDWLAEQITKEHGVHCRFEDDGQPKPLEEDLRILLFTAARELLHNVVKHARASEATVRVQRKGDTIQVIVEDDGVGFAAAQTNAPSGKAGGFGLFSLRERLGYLGGRCEVQSKPGRGTRAKLVAPLKPDRTKP